MPLSWNEIKTRAITFSKEWENESSEDAEAKSFWDDFFNVFGVSRRRVASFEKAVKKQDGKKGFIDLLWKGVILVEHKSRGRDLDKAFQQAKDYFPGLKDYELPKFILVSDFQLFRLYDLDNNTTSEFALKDFIQNVHLFGFIAGYEKRTYKEQDPANIQAAERMGRLHDALEASGYTGHALEVYLVRLLFCLFAEDTSIFERTQFQDYIDVNTKEDGSDLAMHLALLFQVLNTPKEKRLKTLDETLDAFPYVNGKLFEEMLPFAAFDSKMRDMLLFACGLDWSKISPAIFGSMFQTVMNPKERRNLGAHYTSEKNIQKVIKPLFLDNLYTEFEKAKGNKNRLNELHIKIANLHFLDPACGCGNFLIISYRELRQLEIEILRELNKSGQGFLDVREIIRVDVDQFAGIEYDEFPARIAEVAMWLIDHQMNMLVSEEFGQYFVRLPLSKAAKIVTGNALRIDWRKLYTSNTYDVYADEVNILKAHEPEAHYQTLNVHAKQVNIFSSEDAHTIAQLTKSQRFFDYILGNPPFIGKHLQNEAQKADMELVFNGVQGAGVLDYVSAWYLKAAQYIQNTTTKVAFVSTNSISQGEQVGVLWGILFNFYKIKIHFAHRTFSWSNEAKGNAAVHCVIIGFAAFDTSDKRLFDYENIKGEPVERKVKNINPYLAEGNEVLIDSKTKPICNVPTMTWGNKPVDGGNLIFTDEEKEEFIKYEPSAAKYILPLISAKEFLHGHGRWCLWLIDITPNELKLMPHVIKRIEAVKKMRLASVDEGARKLAMFPATFRDKQNPDNYIVIPNHTSENRKYIPFGFFNKNNIPHNSCSIIANGGLFIFGQITSLMHMTWVKYTCGRIKSDYRYSNTIVYNNYPFPQNLSEANKKKVEEAAQVVLDTRLKYPSSSLADLYDPLCMPPDLVKAHQVLDKVVDLCYRPQTFTNELSRIEYLFGLYEDYTAPMFKIEKKKK